MCKIFILKISIQARIEQLITIKVQFIFAFYLGKCYL
jgi:hypothetical protein